MKVTIEVMKLKEDEEAEDDVKEAEEDTQAQEVVESQQPDTNTSDVEVVESSDAKKPEEDETKAENVEKKVEVESQPKAETMADDSQDKEVNKSNLGLWFNLDLRKQIHITPKGWELRSMG